MFTNARLLEDLVSKWEAWDVELLCPKYWSHPDRSPVITQGYPKDEEILFSQIFWRSGP